MIFTAYAQLECSTSYKVASWELKESEFKLEAISFTVFIATLVWFNVELKIRVGCSDNTFNLVVLDGRSAAAAELPTDVALREIFENMLRRFNIKNFLQIC